MSRVYFIFFLVISFFFTLEAQEDIESYLNEANRSYIKGDYDSAYISLNKYLTVTANTGLTDKAIVLGEKIYYFYLRSNISNINGLDSQKIIENLNIYPDISSPRIRKILNQFTDSIDNNLTENIADEDYLYNNSVNYSIDKEYTQEELTRMLKASLLKEQEKSKSLEKLKLVLFIIIPLIILITLGFIIFVTLIRRGYIKGYKLPVYPLIQLAGEEDDELTLMLEECLHYGEQIDQVTGRKNNSQNCAELVYKISIKSGCSEKEALTNFCAALVSDIGFLSVEKSILKSERVTEKDYNDIKNHVNAGISLISFIPEKYRNTFVEAISKHHENLDGSGYPAGLKSDAIPFLPRVLRVAESYLSLISKRDYKAICDSEAALLQLKGDKGKYDQSVVELLNDVI